MVDTIAQVICECEMCAAVKQAKWLQALRYGGRWLKYKSGEGWHIGGVTLPQTCQGKRRVLTTVEATTGWLGTQPVPAGLDEVFRLLMVVLRFQSTTDIFKVLGTPACPEAVVDCAGPTGRQRSRREQYGSSLPFKLVRPARSKVGACWVLLPHSGLLLLCCIGGESADPRHQRAEGCAGVPWVVLRATARVTHSPSSPSSGFASNPALPRARCFGFNACKRRSRRSRSFAKRRKRVLLCEPSSRTRRQRFLGGLLSPGPRGRAGLGERQAAALRGALCSLRGSCVSPHVCCRQRLPKSRGPR